MGQHLGKRETPADSKASSPEPKAAAAAAVTPKEAAEPESPDEVFEVDGSPTGLTKESIKMMDDGNLRGLMGRPLKGLIEADVRQNNGCVSEKPVVTDSTGAEGPHQPWSPASTADPDAATPRPHLVRLFSRDAPGREDNTFKERPSESDELQTIQEHSGAASECGSESPEQDLE